MEHFQPTQRTWINRQLDLGDRGLYAVRTHIAETYRLPLEVYSVRRPGAGGMLRRWVQAQAQDEGIWQRVAEAEAGIDEFEVAKQRAKLGFRPTAEPAVRDAAMLAYLLVVAAGVIGHGRILSRYRPRCSTSGSPPSRGPSRTMGSAAC